MTNTPILIGVAGGTGSGKTTLCKKIAKRIALNVSIICHDSYYKDLSHLPVEERDQQNFDHPDALDNNLFSQHLASLKQGNSVDIPQYDFATHTRHGKVQCVEPGEVILAEGVMLFTDARIRKLLDCKIYIELDADIRFIRRLKRDIHERGRNVDSVIEQYLSTVKPMHDKHVEQSKKYADLVVSGNDLDGAIDSVVIFTTKITKDRKNGN